MAESKDGISAAATADQPQRAPEKIVDASDADVALAAMGYKPVSMHILSRVVHARESSSGASGLTTRAPVDNIRSSSASSDCGPRSALRCLSRVFMAPS